MTTSTTDVQYCCGNKPEARPEDAIIKATSPREIIPAPMTSDDFMEKPVIRAPKPHPISFVIIATMLSNTINQTCSPTPSNVMFNPMLTKTTGTKNEYVIDSTRCSTALRNYVGLIAIPATKEPMTPDSPNRSTK